jgi:citrate lyase subunit beta/citryl-CoA lyase
VTGTLAFRSLLFVAANDAAALSAGYESGADAVVADLEDPVPDGEKQHARDVVAEILPGTRNGTARLVRVNVLDGPFAADDLALAAAVGADAIVVPRATPERIALLPPDGCPVIAVIETAAGLRGAFEVASHPRVRAIALGANDLGKDLGLELRSDGQELLYARSKVVVDAVAAGVRRIDRVCPHGALDALEDDALLGRQLGFSGKSTINPAHVAVINRIFTGRQAVLTRYGRERATVATAARLRRRRRQRKPPVSRSGRITLAGSRSGSGASAASALGTTFSTRVPSPDCSLTEGIALEIALKMSTRSRSCCVIRSSASRLSESTCSERSCSASSYAL